MIDGTQHYRHIVRTWPGSGTGDTVALYGDGTRRYFTARFVTADCNCNSTATRCYTNCYDSLGGTLTVVTKTTEDIEHEAREADAERREKSVNRLRASAHPRLPVPNLKVRRPEFHARSNPR